MKIFEGETISKVYPGMLRCVMEEGQPKTPRGKPTKDLHPIVLHLTNSSSNKFITIPGRQFNYAFALAEIFWILAGRGDYEFIGFYNKNIKQFLDDPVDIINSADMISMTTKTNFHGAYGIRIRGTNIYHESRTDQLLETYKKLSLDRDSRQAVVVLWDKICDNYFKSKDFPCNVLLMFKIINNKLDISVIRRSNDIVWGLPYNIIQFTSIQEYMATWLEIPVGAYYEYIDSLHIYTKEYPDLYNLFVSRKDNQQYPDFGSIHLPKYPYTSTCKNITVMNDFIRIFFDVELKCRQWFCKKQDKKATKHKFEDWLTILNLASPTQYWFDVSKFLLLYHLYKAKEYELLLSYSEDMHIMFQFMGAETFRKISNLVTSQVLSNPQIKQIKIEQICIIIDSYQQKEG